MKAHMEPIAFIVRIFEDGKSYGDPYLVALTVIPTNNKTLKIEGADKVITPSMWRALDTAFTEAGYEYYTFERLRGRKENHTLFKRLRGVKKMTNGNSGNSGKAATFSMSMKIEGMTNDIGNRVVGFEIAIDPDDLQTATEAWYAHMALLFGDGDEESGVKRMKAMAKELMSK